MKHLHLQAKADTSCPLCFVWVAYQAQRGDLVLVGVDADGEGMSREEENHSFLVSGYWTAINRNGEVCAVHRGALEALDRMMHAARESLIKLPGGDS